MSSEITGGGSVGGRGGVGDVSASSRSSGRVDPWPQMEKQVVSMLSELMIQIQRYRDNGSATITSEDETLEAIESCSEAVEDMRFALDTAFDHPESFDITSEELQERTEHIREWERDIARAQQIGAQIRASQRARAQDWSQLPTDLLPAHGGDAAVHVNGSDLANNNHTHNNFHYNNNDILQQEHDAQRDIMRTDDQTLDRLSGGIQRVRETAVNMRDEMTVQERILDDIDQGVTRVQVRLDGVARKVGRLLDQTSDKGKMICIGVLILILFILIVFIVR